MSRFLWFTVYKHVQWNAQRWREPTT